MHWPHPLMGLCLVHSYLYPPSYQRYWQYALSHSYPARNTQWSKGTGNTHYLTLIQLGILSDQWDSCYLIHSPFTFQHEGHIHTLVVRHQKVNYVSMTNKSNLVLSQHTLAIHNLKSILSITEFHPHAYYLTIMMVIIPKVTIHFGRFGVSINQSAHIISHDSFSKSAFSIIDYTLF